MLMKILTFRSKMSSSKAMSNFMCKQPSITWSETDYCLWLSNELLSRMKLSLMVRAVFLAICLTVFSFQQYRIVPFVAYSVNTLVWIDITFHRRIKIQYDHISCLIYSRSSVVNMIESRQQSLRKNIILNKRDNYRRLPRIQFIYIL